MENNEFELMAGYDFMTDSIVIDCRNKKLISLISAAPDMLSVLIQAIEESGFSVNGPTNWNAAEDGEPKWVCNAREVIAKATGGDK